MLAAPSGAAVPQPSDAELLDRLRAGELVVYFRHADTRSGAGSVAELDGCGGERNLSEVGREQMRAVAAALAAIEAPVGDVLSSPTCRTRETAMIGFGRAEPIDLLHSLLGTRPEDPRPMETLRLFSIAPADGSIRVMVAHQSNLRVPLGTALDEGEAAILLPSPAADTPPELLARLMPSDWTRLAQGIDR